MSRRRQSPIWAVDRIEFFPIRIPCAGFLQHPGRLGKIMLHGCLIVFFVEHLFLEHFADKSRDAGFLFCSAESGPEGDFLIKGDGYIFHNENIVRHEVRIK